MGLRHLRQAVNIGGGTGTQDFTVSGIGTPSAAILFISSATSNGTEANHALLGIGFTDGTNHRSMITSAEHGVGTSNAWMRLCNDKPLITIDPNTGAVNGVLGFSSWITDGIRLDVSDLPPAAYFVHIIFFVEEGSGYDLVVGDFSDADSSKTLGWEPDQLFAFGASGAYSSGFLAHNAGSTDAHISGSIGFLDNGSSLVERSIGFTYYDAIAGGAGANDAYSYISEGNTLADAEAMAAQLTPTGTGFNISASLCYGAYLAVKYNGNHTHAAGSSATPTSTGSQSVTTGHDPAFVLELQSILTAFDSLTQSYGYCFCIGLMHPDTNNDHSLNFRVNNDAVAGNTTTKTRSSQNSASLLKDPTDSGGAGSLVTGTLTSFGSGQYTKNFSTTDATARKLVWLSVGPPPAAGQPARRRFGMCNVNGETDPAVRYF